MATKKKSNKEKAIEKVNSSAMVATERPDFVTGGASEAMGSEELLLPRIEVAQALSPQIDEEDPSYIEGLKAGYLFNTATGEIYGKELTFVPVVYRKEYLLFQDRNLGGGFGGTYDTHNEAMEAAKSQEGDGWEAMLALSNMVFILNIDATVKEIAYLSCTKTKVKVAKRMNTFLQMINAPRYASVFSLTPVKEDGQKGTYYNFAINSLGWLANADTFAKARELSEQMKGKKIMSNEKIDDEKENVEDF